MRIDPAGWPFVLGGLIVAIVAGFFAGTAFGSVLLVLTVFFLFFFRDPERQVSSEPGAVLSPADGRVMLAGPSTAQKFPAPAWQQISIFLSPMDVHINRMPVGGRVTKVEYHPGRFLPAFKADAGDLNEYTEVTVDAGGRTVVFRQIVGILARRIVCRVKAGDQRHAGDRMGVMKFGSRMDVFLPADAVIHAQVNQKVVAARTVIATLKL
ncbi:MAG TPA: phosphatidylserine decarboxylase [Vicinamibacterales bacterium]|nr:phosphatidylserine decarboxylase [Vicinamibacterales bacterium]